MSQPPEATSGGDAPRGTRGGRGVGSSAVKGALLIGLAIIIGVVLLQQVDDGKGGTTASTTGTTRPKPKTTTTVRRRTTTTTIAARPTKTPAELRVFVLNGGAPAGAAKNMSTHLTQMHYTNQPKPASNWPNHNQQGNTVLCKTGLDREAVTLSVAVGQGTQVQVFPTPPPPESSDVDCVVVVGGSGTATTSTTAATQSN